MSLITFGGGGSLPCGSMSNISNIGTSTLNDLLSPWKTLDSTLFQILKISYFKPSHKTLLQIPRNHYFRPPGKPYLKPQKIIFQTQETLFKNPQKTLFQSQKLKIKVQENPKTTWHYRKKGTLRWILAILKGSLSPTVKI